jgi:cyclohexanecarboxylate-CoA ligase
MGQARRRLRPTFTPSRADAYRRSAGPWDRGPLPSGFAPSPRASVVDDAGVLPAGELEDAVATLAGRLRRAGVRRGQVVAWQLPNSAVVVTLYRACWRLGAVAAPVHHRMGEAEVAAALDQVDPAVVVADPDLPAARWSGARTVAGAGRAGLGGLLAHWESAPSQPATSPEVRAGDLAVVLFTSGSTGTPKAVLHTHRGLGYKAAAMVGVHGLGPDDAVLMPAPLAHVSGLLNGVLLPGAAGIPSVLMAAWDPGRALELVEQHRVSFVGAPPVFFSQLAEAPRFAPARVASLRLVSTGGASVSPAFVDSTAATFGCRVKRTYGSTEAPTVTSSAPDDPVERARDTDGRPLGAVQLQIRHPETGEPRRGDESGEIWLRGPELFVGYADAGATASVLSYPGGWFRTGDLGVLDPDGWLRVVGRLSDVIIRAGENISASEVEAVLEAHPAIRHAVAVPVPDDAVGERVAAYVEAAEGFDLTACREWFAARGVTRYKTPEFVVRLDAVPALAAGKPDRAALRRRAAAPGGPA